jgi:hypothetical protein
MRHLIRAPEWPVTGQCMGSLAIGAVVLQGWATPVAAAGYRISGQARATSYQCWYYNSRILCCSVSVYNYYGTCVGGLLCFCTLVYATVAGVVKSIFFMQQSVSLCDLSEVGRRADGPMQQHRWSVRCDQRCQLLSRLERPCFFEKLPMACV